MQVKFWGTRGSLPVAMKADKVRDKIVQALQAARGKDLGDDQAIADFVDNDLDFSVAGTYGGASSCVEIDFGNDEFVICDMGSGLREFGIDSLRRINEGGKKGAYTFFMSHPHWDHIMGFPFFAPAFMPTNNLKIVGGHDMEFALRRQQDDPSFPVPLDWMGAPREFHVMQDGDVLDTGAFTVKIRKQPHHGDSYGYRFEKGGKAVVYTTDAEHKLDDMDEFGAHVAFMRDADLVIFDTMYSMADAISVKEDWGHSSNIVAVDMCHQAGVKQLAMFHHEPVFDDAMILQNHMETIRYEELVRPGDDALRISCAYDGLVIDL